MRRSTIKKRSVIIFGHKTSVSLEDEFWDGLAEIARGDGITLARAIEKIGNGKQVANLSSEIRTAVLAHYICRAKNSD